MREAYTALHNLGVAHSIEVMNGGRLVGGLYGVMLDKMFFGESMFSLEPNASKAAFIALCQACHARGIELIDCQVRNPHLMSLGAALMWNTIAHMQEKDSLERWEDLKQKYHWDEDA